MRVLLANSPFGGGGVTSFATALVKCLSADTELTVVLGDDTKAPIIDPRVKVIYHDTMSLTIGNALFFINLINNIVKPNVIIVSTAIIIPIIVPYINDDIKVITVSHSGRFFFTKYCALNHRYLDNIIAASSNYNKQYIEKKFRISAPEKVKVVYNFLAEDKEFEDLRLEKVKQSPIMIVYSGANSVHKAPELVSKILYNLLKTPLDFRFFWTGNTSIPLTTNIMKWSRLKDVKQLFQDDPRLCFTGRIPLKKDYDLLLGKANVFLAPSRNEGCSMATIEAHRSGCIILVADFENSNREIVEKGKSGFVINHNDINGFVSTISDIITNQDNYAHLYEDAHTVFKTMFSYPVWRDKIFAIINSEASHKKRKKRISKLAIMCDIIRMKYLEKSSDVERFLCYSLPSFLSFRKQFKEMNKTHKNY